MSAKYRIPTFAERFDPRANSLNFIRLLLAAGVIVWHSFPLTGSDIEFAPIRQALGYLFVDGFFAISGYLIVRSWIRDPHLVRYLAARVIRIYPAFWICLIVTGLAIAPIGNAIAAGTPIWDQYSWQNLTYVTANSTLVITQVGIDGTPLATPFTGSWNGSLWTLQWEFLCYLGVAALGLTGLLRRRWTIPALFTLSTAAVVLMPFIGTGFDAIEYAARFATMFLAGAFIHSVQNRLPLNWPLIGMAAGIVSATMALPSYRAVGALPLAYVILGVGTLMTGRSLRFRNDISYGMYVYAFPMQQLLASAGLWALGVPTFAILSIAVTLPLAALSWFLIERTSLRLKPKKNPPRAAVQDLVMRG